MWLDFFGPWRKLPGMAPNRAGRMCFLLIQTLPTFWAERIWILTFFTFFIFWIPNFWISGFIFPKSGLGRAGLGPWAGWALGWAGLGPWTGWAPRVGPLGGLSAAYPSRKK